MKNKFRLTAIILLLCCLLPLCSCSSGAGMPAEDNRAVASVNGKYDVSLDLYRYFYLNYLSMYTDADFADGGAAAEAELRELCFTALRSAYATIALCAEYGITPEDDDIVAAADASVDSTVEEYGGKAEYAAALRENNMTDTVFRFMMKLDACEDALYATLTDGLGVLDVSDEAFTAALYGDSFIRIVQVLISDTNGFDDAKNRATAETVLQKARAGEDFDKLIGNYSNDYSMTQDGYYFTYNYMLPELEEAAFALQPGEVSDIIVTRNGYHILKRLEKEEDYMIMNYASLKAQYESCLFYELLDDEAEKLTVTGNALLDTFNRTNMKAN